MIDEDIIWTKYNLNEKGNPLPQYKKYSSYLTKEHTTTGYLKIFDSEVQFDQSLLLEKDRNLTTMSFTALVDTNTDSYYREKSLLDVNFTVSNEGTGFSYAINMTPLSNSLGKAFKGVIGYKQVVGALTPTYSVQIYLWLPVSYANIRVVFLDFYSESSINRYAINGDYNNIEYTALDRIKFYLGDNIRFNSVIQTLPTGITYSSTINSPRATIDCSDVATSISVYAETKFVSMGGDVAHSLDTINCYGLIDKGTIITLKFYNDKSTVVNTGNIDSVVENKIVLKGLVNVTPAIKGQTITLQYDGLLWIEIARNF